MAWKNQQNQAKLEKDEESLQKKAIDRWRRHPHLFVSEVLGVNKKNGFKISNQQLDLLKQVGHLSYAKRINAELKQQGKPVPPRVAYYANKLGVTVRSGKGTGKDTCSAWLVLWFLCLFNRARIPCVGPVGDQLRKVFWPEVAKWLYMTNSKGEYIVAEEFRTKLAIDREKIYWTEAKVPGQEWFAFPKTVQRSADESTMRNALGGQHEDNMMIILDEAAGIPNAMAESLENTMTKPNNFAILIWNPNTTSGFAYDTWYDPAQEDHWLRFHWDAEDSDNVSDGFIEMMEKKYGRDSDNFRVYVKGEPPRGGGSYLINLEWVEDAVRRECFVHPKEYTVMGVDPSAGGSDPTICCIRRGPKIIAFERIHLSLPEDIASSIIKIGYKYKVKKVFIDNNGPGEYLPVLLNPHFEEVHGLKSSERARNSERFMRRRDEFWWVLRERFQEGRIDIPNIKDLKDQLSSVDYDMLTFGKVKVESKDSMKKRLGTSTDYADALALAIYFEDVLEIPEERKPYDAWDDDDDDDLEGYAWGSSGNWMVA